MDASNAITYFCISTASGYLIGHLSEFIFDLIARSPPLHVVLVYHFILSFILVAIYSARHAFTRRPGTLQWDHHFGSVEEAFDFVKIAVFWWLVLFNLAVGMEGFALGIHALPFILDWRQEHCDDPDYLPVLMRLNWENIRWMGGLIGEMGSLLLWHIQIHWAELMDYLEQKLREADLQKVRDIANFVTKRQNANPKNDSR